VFVVVALLSAAAYGAADFLGGLTSKRADTLAIVVLSQCSGLVLLAVMLPFVADATVTSPDAVWAVAAGVTGGTGVAVLYHALAVGTMAVVAPVTAVCAVVIPVAVAVMLGERPGSSTILGIVVALLAIGLLSRSAPVNQAGRRSGLGLACAAGIAIGLFFVCLARTGRDAGLWPLLLARLASVPLFGVMTLVARRPLTMAPRVAMMAISGGALDMLANLLYLIATRLGPLSIVVTLASLYPASTVLLARLTLGERLTAPQAIGVACAVAAIVVIVRSTA
jgi:uncharacterized membrane protein